VDVPRGSDTPASELGGILAHAGASVCLAVGEEAALRALAAQPAGGPPRTIVRLDAGPGEAPPGALSGAEVLERGGGPADPASLPAVRPEDPASLVYTSGTTGRPKGATLLHRNFLHQVEVLPAAFDIHDGDVFLATLPPWHCFERIVEYLAARVGAEVAFSAPRDLPERLPEAAPTWMASVPRVWEMILATSGHARLARRDPGRAAEALREALGGRLRCAVAGGGTVPPEVDDAYNGAGIRFLVGYGLTETAPVLTVRRFESNRTGTLGRPVEGTEIRIADRDTGAPLPPGRTGVILARGPQVMRGYWDDPGLTGAVLSREGWFDTGDLGATTPEGDLVFRGRAKDTIALRGGEKIEPSRLEDRLGRSPLIEQAVVVGDDRKVLGALVVPRRKALEGALRGREGEEGAAGRVLREECARLLTADAGFAPHERIAVVRVLEEPLTTENGLLTATLKVRRSAVLERYADLVRGMFAP